MPRHRYHALITSIDKLRERCDVDPATHCWIWQGAVNARSKTPVLYAFDHARADKRAMSGPLAAWNIAHAAAPLPGSLVFRCCGSTLCLNPAHLREARSRAEIGLHQRRAGYRKGTSVEARRENVRLAWAAQGIVVTPPEAVRAIRSAPSSVTGRALAERFGISPQAVSRIRRGLSHRDVA